MNEVPHDDSSAPDLIDELADEFLCRLQAGESPSVSEYCRLHPDLAGPIGELFPTLMILEDAKSSTREEPRLAAPPPDEIGGYRLIRRIGQGGMGVVYKAHRQDLDRPVALKVLSQRLAHDQRALNRFQREARAIAKLHHTNIVPLYEVGTENGYFFLAMQLIVGRSLDQVIPALRGASDIHAPLTPWVRRHRETLARTRSDISNGQVKSGRFHSEARHNCSESRITLF